jgi:hypothetical protein
MTTISQTAVLADVQVAPQAKTRNAALDRTRTFLTLVVLLHHAEARSELENRPS